MYHLTYSHGCVFQTDVEDAKSLREAHSFCEERYISAIECRTKLGHQDVKKIGGGAVCDLNSGLVCSDALGCKFS